MSGVQRAYYSNSLLDFIKDDNLKVLGEIASNDQFGADDLQRNAWIKQIEILKAELEDLDCGDILFEYTIPRIGNRVDNVLIYKGIIFLIEFKVGERNYNRESKEQVIDYALDLSYFHEESHNRLLVPILVCTRGKTSPININVLKENILDVHCSNGNDLSEYIKFISDKYPQEDLNASRWINSLYRPTPTIIEAARALYMGHDVEDISRSDASATNLNQTSTAINEIIDFSKENKRKSICFITGVPGAGKTLAGLNIAVERQRYELDEHAVFLSGNGPLVNVLQEALARDESERDGVTLKESRRKSKEFIQLIHHFRDEAISTESAPIERVVIFDEAQRAWDEKHLENFMRQKKGVLDFNMSEPDFLISILDRHEDWATIICLIGGGQEINKGESAGIGGWFDAIKEHYSDWDVYVSDKITDEEYLKDNDFHEMTHGVNYSVVKDLHLAVSLRSFRSEKVSEFVKALLDEDQEHAKELYKEIKTNYPILMTRNLDTAKNWIKDKAKGSERYGLTASSSARRLRKYGVWVQNETNPVYWFLNDKEDVRSSDYLEEVATEFDIQGLELDWSIVCWDADLRYDKGFKHYNFRGTNWQNIHNEDNILYLKNAYRVLLTRARQGFIIYIPEGDDNDRTTLKAFYDGIHNYLREIEIEEI